MSLTELITLFIMDAWRTITGRNRLLDNPEGDGGEEDEEDEEDEESSGASR